MTRSWSNLIVFILSLAGCFLSAWLTLKYVQHQSIPCGWMHSDCDVVANDHYAKGLGITGLEGVPTPAFGILMYASIAALSFWRVAATSESAGRLAGLAQISIAAVAVIISAALTWREWAIGHWCIFCLTSAAIVVCTFLALVADRFVKRPMRREEARIQA